MDMTQTAKLTASDAAIDDRFGISVAIYGGTVAVGASFADIGMNGDQGAAYVFAKPSLGWANSTQTAKLTASDGAASDFLGWSVALNGDTVAAGAFGDTIGMNEDQGSAYVFVRPGADWVNMTETARLIASDGATDDTLGYSIAIDDDTVVAGANGDTIGSNQGQGSAYVFVRPAGGWASSVQTAKLTASDGQAMDWLGLSVAVSGETIVAGAFAHDVDGNDQQGSAYVYAKPAGGWADMTETDQLTASDGAAFDRLGWSASIDGDTVVVGAYTDSIGANSQQGSAYVFYYETRLRIYFPLIAR
jgi:hypothetical protein